MSHDFAIGDRVRILSSKDSNVQPAINSIIGSIQRIKSIEKKFSKPYGIPGLGRDDCWWFEENELELVKKEVLSKEERELEKLRKALADKEKAIADKAKRAEELKKKRELNKVMKNLNPAAKRAALYLRGNEGDFGCQRQNVIKLTAAITGCNVDDLIKAVNV